MDRKRVRECGIQIGQLNTGQNNAITDVKGVRVGHETITHDGINGKDKARTGVTVILPHSGDLYSEKVCAAVHTINGYGKPHGMEQVREIGNLESPIALTNTLNVGLVSDSLIQYMLDENTALCGGDGFFSLNVLVGETNDGYLNDLSARYVRREHVFSALQKAKESGDFAPVAEGAVGGGTGTHYYGWKGGIGTASRVLPETVGGYTIGVLVQSNFGLAADLMINGVRVGDQITPDRQNVTPVTDKTDKGSIMIVLATDAPLNERQLGRLARRASVGLARTGSFIGHQSGDFVVAFSTANPIKREPECLTTNIEIVAHEDKVIPWLFRGVIESVEEAVLNSMFMATTTVGRKGHVKYALPIEQVLQVLRR